MAKIRVAIADDHAMLRSGLKMLINTQPDLSVVGEAGNHAETRSIVAATSPQILTLDLSMPGGQPMKLIEDLVRDHPTTRILVLTMHEDPAYLRMSLAAGASGYLVKRSADSDLLDAIRTVARGGIYAQANSAAVTLAQSDQESRSSLESLSDREREVLLGLAQGHTNQELADQLFLSVKTVESYRARLMVKLGLHNRAELTRFAISSGLLGPNPNLEK